MEDSTLMALENRALMAYENRAFTTYENRALIAYENLELTSLATWNIRNDSGGKQSRLKPPAEYSRSLSQTTCQSINIDPVRSMTTTEILCYSN